MIKKTLAAITAAVALFIGYAAAPASASTHQVKFWRSYGVGTSTFDDNVNRLVFTARDTVTDGNCVYTQGNAGGIVWSCGGTKIALVSNSNTAVRFCHNNNGCSAWYSTGVSTA